MAKNTLTEADAALDLNASWISKTTNVSLE